MPTATAQHILVDSKEACDKLKTELETGADFDELAAKHSKCPSGKKGGDLGSFSKGRMVPEFDKVIFADEIGKVHGPIRTQFGWHLILINSRED